MDEQQQERFGQAVERKKTEAEEASERADARNPASEPVTGSPQPGIESPDRNQDQFSIRDKNTGKGKKTADKWNQ